MTSSLVKSKQIIGAHFSTLFSAIFLSLLFRNIQIDWIILKTYDQQFTLTTKKSLHIIKQSLISGRLFVQEGQHPLTGQRAANFRLLANQ